MVKIVYAFFYAISLLPFRLLYCIADFEYFMMYYVIKYRRGIVRKNLTTSFPEKSEEEIVDIEKKFYRWFSDYFFEAVKLLSISDKELRRRFKVYNSEEVEQCFQEGQDVAAILGHYCNWEWLSCVGIKLPKTRIIGLIYHPLRNQAFDELFKRIRSHEENGVPVPKKDILRYLVDYKRKNIRSIFGYISDQGPKWENIHLWLPFLNHPETPVFTGGERIMRKMNDAVFYVEMSRPKRGYYTATYKLITRNPNSLPEHEITRRFLRIMRKMNDAVFYVEMSRPKRGYYTATYKLITRNPNSLPEHEITRRFFQMLEETIRKNPPYYLWTHNRWKRTKEEFDKRYEVVKGKVVPKEM